MRISVIIPCYNAASTIGCQLEAIASQEWSEPWEVIVADNGSTDNSVAIVKTFQERIPSLVIVDASAKRGPSFARNCGASVAKGEGLAFCDADDEVAPGWIAAMGEALAKYDYVGGYCLHNKLNEPWLAKRYGSEKGSGVDYDHPYLPIVPSCNMGVKRAVHEAVGGFDENFMMIEDIDYCWRIQEMGVKVHDAWDAIVQYRLRKEFKVACQRAWAIGLHEALLYKKHKGCGMPKLMSWKTFIKVPIKFVLELALLRVRDEYTMLENIRMLAWRAGQLQGCFKFKYLPI
ncbi:glycosyl transferase family 2 [Calothrix sp. HK-06]|nr:glycosyl transferase family 2 [Calothrix sp. HK-06]